MWRRIELTVLIAGVLLGGGKEVRAAGDPAYGAYLAGECRSCHRPDAAVGTIPPLEGLPIAYLVQALKAYRSGERANEVMGNVARSLGDAEIEALAAHFAQAED